MKAITGYSKNGLPYFRIGGGPRSLVIFGGLSFKHQALSGLAVWGTSWRYRHFAKKFTTYYIGRKPGLPVGYSIQNMSEDYVVMVKNEITAPVDLMGISTGGPIAQQFAADHPELVHRLVLAMTGYHLIERGAGMQRKLIDLTLQGKWRAAAAVQAGITSGLVKPVATIVFWLLGKVVFENPHDPADGVAELEAEDKFDFTDRLAEIKAPTLVIGGDKDCFYPIPETAKRIPSAKLILYKNTGHTAMLKPHFNRDVMNFLTQRD
jgi:pimeloyl-ACP methyl ester carboxylesterase